MKNTTNNREPMFHSEGMEKLHDTESKIKGRYFRLKPTCEEEEVLLTSRYQTEP